MVFVGFGVVRYDVLLPFEVPREFLLSGHVGDCEKSYKERMILMCLFTDTKKSVTLYIVHTFLRLFKIIQILYDG